MHVALLCNVLYVCNILISERGRDCNCWLNTSWQTQCAELFSFLWPNTPLPPPPKEKAGTVKWGHSAYVSCFKAVGPGRQFKLGKDARISIAGYYLHWTPSTDKASTKILSLSLPCHTFCGFILNFFFLYQGAVPMLVSVGRGRRQCLPIYSLLTNSIFQMAPFWHS